MNPRDDFEPPLDAEAAGLENQLLTLEIQVARARLRAAEGELARLRSGRGGVSGPEGSVVITKDEYDELRTARSNLRWLLGRLGAAPVGWIMRRRKGYRVLADRWLADRQRGTE